jgi:hypothetical protein
MNSECRTLISTHSIYCMFFDLKLLNCFKSSICGSWPISHLNISQSPRLACRTLIGVHAYPLCATETVCKRQTTSLFPPAVMAVKPCFSNFNICLRSQVYSSLVSRETCTYYRKVLLILNNFFPAVAGFCVGSLIMVLGKHVSSSNFFWWLV